MNNATTAILGPRRFEVERMSRLDNMRLIQEIRRFDIVAARHAGYATNPADPDASAWGRTGEKYTRLADEYRAEARRRVAAGANLSPWLVAFDVAIEPTPPADAAEL